jgi:hypothetical protein
MRNVLILAMALACSAPCFAEGRRQETIRSSVYAGSQTGRCSPSMNTRRGRVTTLDDRTVRGHVQCLDGTDLVVEKTSADDRGRVRRQVVVEPMSNVERVVQLPDSIGDGVVKGMAVGLLTGLFARGRCDDRSPAWCTIEAVAGTAAIGGFIDWAHGRSWVLYSAPGVQPAPSRGIRPTLSFRWHF